jgi:DNA-binding Lrp family transcriptional regulator
MEFDRIDRQLIHGLMIDGRAPFSRLGEIIGCSEQTAARRFRRLREHGVIRVLVLAEPARPGLDWFVRAQVKPGAADRLAQALAQRDDVIWVSIIAGGAEVMCVSRPASEDQRDALLLERLPATNVLTGLTAHAVLHKYDTERVNEWSAFGDPLDGEQIAALLAGREQSDGDAVVTPEDEPLVRLLREDGRASYAQLAAASGLSPARAARRLGVLLGSGAMYIDLEVVPDLLGFPARAMLWLTVDPAELDRVGRGVARLPETAFAGALTGTSNLGVSIACADTERVYRYVTEELGSLAGVRRVEISLIARGLKQAGSRLQDGRLPRP